MTAVARPNSPTFAIGARSVGAGVLAAAGLLGVYLGIISLAQGAEHALEQLVTDGVFVGAIAIGFGIQIALFVELRAVDRRHQAAAAMLACCAHHLVDLLPLIGLSAAAVFLNAYKTPMFLIGIGMNLIGIVVIARQLQRARRACAVVEGPASVAR